MEQFIDVNLSTYGPFAVFILLMLSGVGIALTEEMVTIPAGVFIATGRFDFWTTAICAYVGIVLADCLWYYICRHYGTPFLHRPWMKRLLHPRRLLQLKHQLDRRGAWFIVISRFIPGSRTSAITVAGVFRLSFWKFFGATATCVLITMPIQLGLGYLIGAGLSAEKSLADLLLRIAGLVLLIIVATLVIGWITRHAFSRERPPRAKAAWLRHFRPARLRQKRSVASPPRSSTGDALETAEATVERVIDEKVPAVNRADAASALIR